MMPVLDQDWIGIFLDSLKAAQAVIGPIRARRSLPALTPLADDLEGLVDELNTFASAKLQRLRVTVDAGDMLKNLEQIKSRIAGCLAACTEEEAKELRRFGTHMEAIIDSARSIPGP